MDNCGYQNRVALKYGNCYLAGPLDVPDKWMCYFKVEETTAFKVHPAKAYFS